MEVVAELLNVKPSSAAVASNRIPIELRGVPAISMARIGFSSASPLKIDNCGPVLGTPLFQFAAVEYRAVFAPAVQVVCAWAEELNPASNAAINPRAIPS